MLYLTAILPLLATGVTILMTGILMTRTPGESLQCALTEGLFWATGLCLCFSMELLIFESL